MTQFELLSILVSLLSVLMTVSLYAHGEAKAVRIIKARRIDRLQRRLERLETEEATVRRRLRRAKIAGNLVAVTLLEIDLESVEAATHTTFRRLCKEAAT